MLDELNGDSELSSAEILHGRPITALVDLIVESSFDLVMKDASCDSEDLFMGSLDFRLMRLSTEPVWIVDPDSGNRLERILVAVDPMVCREKMRMNEELIRLSSKLARQESAELHIVAACGVPMSGAETGSVDYQSWFAGPKIAERRVWKNLRHVTATSLVRIPRDRIHFVRGDASNRILDAADETAADLVVMENPMASNGWQRTDLTADRLGCCASCIGGG
ncbi:MAG: universal stress protein [Planctomycetota bacterium]